MSDALSAGDVQAAVDDLNGTPFIRLLVKPFIEGSVFFINFYDFWNDISFQCLVPSFSWAREHKSGGATGNISYQAAIKEVGPLKEGGLGNTVISALMTVLGTWDDINDVVGSYTVTSLLDSAAGVVGIIATEVAGSVAAVNAQVSSVQELMGGNVGATLASRSGNDGIAAFFAASQRMINGAEQLVTVLNQAGGTGSFDNDTGAITRASPPEKRALAIYERISEAEAISEAGRFYDVAGVFFGLSRGEYHAFITSGGTRGLHGPDAAGSARHVVAVTDTPESIELRYGVSWSRILDINGLTPDEALYPGTVLEIPVPRPAGPQGIRGLPTFGSHVGRAAWGTDLPLELTAVNGIPSRVIEEDALQQGATFLIEQQGDALLKALQGVPDAVRSRYLARRLAAIFLLDGRFESTEQIAVTFDPDSGAFAVDATLHAINGGTITTGGQP